MEAQGYKFKGTDGASALKVTKDSMTVLKTERTANLYKVIKSMVIGDASVATEKEDITRLWHICLGHMRKVFKPYTAKEFYQVLSTANSTFVSFALWINSRVAFVISMHKTKSLLDLVRTYVWGSSPVASVRGACYYVTFIDDFS